MAIGFSPGCPCCSPCNNCDGGVPSKLQVALPDFFNAFGTGVICCPSVKGSYLLDFSGSNPSIVSQFGGATCIWFIGFAPANLRCRFSGIAAVLTKLNDGTYSLDIYLLHTLGNTFHVFSANLPSKPTCTAWVSLLVPVKTPLILQDCTVSDPALVS